MKKIVQKANIKTFAVGLSIASASVMSFMTAAHLSPALTRAPAAAGKPLKHTYKLGSPLNVEIEPVGTPVPGQPITLRGHVQVGVPIPELKLRWTVPAEITLTSGERETVLYNVLPNQPVENSISFVIPADNNYPIHFAADSIGKNTSFGKVAQWNTTLQDYFDQENRALAGRASEYDPDSKGTR